MIQKLAKGTVIHVNGVPCELLTDIEVESETELAAIDKGGDRVAGPNEPT